jgi:cytochrome b561
MIAAATASWGKNNRETPDIKSGTSDSAHPDPKNEVCSMKEKEGFHFGRISIINHWTMAILFLCVLSLGFVLDFLGSGRAIRGPWMEAHKAGGVILLLFGLWRVSWRLRQGFPKDVVHMPAWQHVSAKLVHWMLLFAIIAMPLSGLLMSLFSERAINVFGLFVIPAQAENETISRIGSAVHEILAYIVAGTILMHVGAVAKHHLIDRDDTLKRMLRVRKEAPPPVLNRRAAAARLAKYANVSKSAAQAARKTAPGQKVRPSGTYIRG